MRNEDEDTDKEETKEREIKRDFKNERGRIKEEDGEKGE